MKVIYLLNKIANGEEVPEKFKYKNKIYEAQKRGKFTTYKNNFGETLRDISGIFYLEACLNDELEIIEEDKEIEEIKLDGQLILEWNLSQIENKINELVDAVNELKKGK